MRLIGVANKNEVLRRSWAIRSIMEQVSRRIEKHVSQFHSCMDLAELYYVYPQTDLLFVEQPFTSHIPDVKDGSLSTGL